MPAKKKAEPTGTYLVVQKNIGEISPYKGNPRKNLKGIEAVANSIREFGFRQPIVTDPDGVIIAGHTRYYAALHLGLHEVPVHVADLDPIRTRAYRIADNQLASLSGWDYDLLNIELDFLNGEDFDVNSLGFLDNDFMGASAFSPEVNPKTDGHDITDQDILDASGGLNANLQRTGDHTIDTTCPKCFHSYKVQLER